MDDNSDDDTPRLSAETMEALLEFRKEQESFGVSISVANDPRDPSATEHENSCFFHEDMHCSFPEDWQMSQFWYDDETSNKLADVVKNLSDHNNKIACISCPSVFKACGYSENVHLYEYDKRFAAFGSTYFFYDYNQPEDVPEECVGSYAVVIADPPFLAEECLEKLSLTINKLLQPNGKIILCTGAVMEKTASELLSLKKTLFIPTHKKNLGNTFACFANFELDIKQKEN